MRNRPRTLRIAGILLACVASFVVGLALVFRFLTPQDAQHLRTPELLALLGLVILPPTTLAALHAFRAVTPP